MLKITAILGMIFLFAVPLRAQSDGNPTTDSVKKSDPRQVEKLQEIRMAIDSTVQSTAPGPAGGTKTAVNLKCLVTGEELAEDAVTLEYGGKLYGFCCGGCRKKFEKDPEKYLKKLRTSG